MQLTPGDLVEEIINVLAEWTKLKRGKGIGSGALQSDTFQQTLSPQLE